VFFGPRKLPQLSRSLGKSMAEFRRASDDFKRTWEREVSLEESTSDRAIGSATLANENSSLEHDSVGRTLQSPTIEPVAADQVIPRQPFEVEAPQSSDSSDFADDRAETPRKRDWL
jgi:Sec-independent protein translocase protein TatA